MDQAVTRHRTQIEGLQQRRDQLTATVDDSGLPTDPDVLVKALAAAEDAQQALVAARTAERQAIEAERQARRDAETANQAIAAAWQAFDEAWSQVARHDPPAVSDRNDLVGAWTALVDWATVRGPELDDQAVAAEAAVEQTRARWRDERATLEQACRQAGLEVPGGDVDLRDLAVRAFERATSDVGRLQELIAESARLRQELSEARRQHQIAKALGNHLTARKFEQWLLRRALQRLVAGATVILNDLSNGSYSLSLDDNNNFQVTDHRNADQLRSARTLSGGETFLASLALALALAEHVADLSAQGAARLEALFLDEGFGTLDADTLDVVASALEELGSRGRMVGVITHVPDLAQRMPVRFDVRKVGASSTVTRANDLGAQT
jgi:exonuclease SbcC